MNESEEGNIKASCAMNQFASAFEAVLIPPSNRVDAIVQIKLIFFGLQRQVDSLF